MPKSLAELRASSHAALPERTMELCLSQALVSEVEALDIEKRSLSVETARKDGEESGPKPRKADPPADPRVAEIDARLEELYDEMREHTGQLVLRATTGGEWRRWVDAHPARVDDKFDEGVAYGYCNASDLLAALGDYAVSWNGTPLSEGDWEFIENRAAPGDLKVACQTVVQMHEAGGLKAPKSQRALSVVPTNEPA
jgi:hypothetical protein